jgi:hypothetical protein
MWCGHSCPLPLTLILKLFLILVLTVAPGPAPRLIPTSRAQPSFTRTEGSPGRKLPAPCDANHRSIPPQSRHDSVVSAILAR